MSDDPASRDSCMLLDRLSRCTTVALQKPNTETPGRGPVLPVDKVGDFHQELDAQTLKYSREITEAVVLLTKVWRVSESQSPPPIGMFTFASCSQTKKEN